MPGSGFWFFVLIIVVNLVIGIVRKVAERRAAREAALRAAGGEASTAATSPQRATLQGGSGNYEVILERPGERQIDVMRVLRHDLGMDAATAVLVIGSAPTPIALGISRGDAGLLRNRLEELGAGVVVRRTSAATGVGSSATATPSRQQLARSLERGLDRAERLEQRRDRSFEQADAAATRTARQGRGKGGSERSGGGRRGGSQASPPPRPAVPTQAPAPPARAAVSRQPSRGGPLEPVAVEAAELAAAAGAPRLDAGSIDSIARDPTSLQRAFVLAELLQSPVSMRPQGSGGR